MPSPESTSLPAPLQRQLLAVAQESIRHGLRHGVPLRIDLDHFPEPLREKRATFVTLQIKGKLRGCIGTLEARAPLVVDVSEHAYAAAFEDPRFPPVAEPEFQSLEIHISVLSPTEPLPCSGEMDLLEKLRPGVDGLILRAGFRSATFLPSVWEELPEPGDFVRYLKQKAGLAPDEWPPSMKVFRYTCAYV